MALYIDTANLDEIEAFLAFGRFAGVTTNPTLLARERAAVEKRLPEIVQRMPKGLLFAQARELPPEKMVEDALRLHSFAPGRVVVKIPFCENGLLALPMIADKQIRTCPTAVFNAAQAYLAAAMGADWVAIYVNRITKQGGDGLEVVRTACGIFEANKLPTRVLAASIKGLDEAEALLEMGERVDVTVPFTLFQNMLSHPASEQALENFALDAAKVF